MRLAYPLVNVGRQVDNAVDTQGCTVRVYKLLPLN